MWHLLRLLACSAPLLVHPADEGENDDLVRVEVRTDGPVTCADPAARDEAAYDVVDGGPGWAAQARGSEQAPTPWGMAVGDFDGDGNADVFLPQNGRAQLFFGAGDWTFEDRSDDALPPGEAHATAASMADVDGDGDLDLFVGNKGQPNEILLNDGAGVFAEADTGFDTHFATHHAAWGDLDGDGDLDLFVANFFEADEHAEGVYDPDPNELWLNDGDGAFTDVSDRLDGFAAAGWTNAAGWYDLDGDADLDLFVVNEKPDEGFTTVARLNDGAGELVDDRGACGLDVAIEGMGLGVGDLNGDLRPDFLVSGWGQNAMLESGSDGAWYDTARTKGLVADDGERFVAWGAELQDVDDDGDLDALVAYGAELDYVNGGVAPSEEPNPEDQRDALFLQLDDGRFMQAAEAWGLDDPGIHRGFVLADLDHDGWLDVVKRDLWGGATLFRARCGDAGWLGVRLRQPGPNAFAVSARVEVEAGGVTRARWISAGSTNLASAGPPEAHFGLGDLDSVDVVRVIWPDGARSEVRDLATRQWVTLVREETD